MPILLVIIDEYLELFHHHPEWIDLVIHIGGGSRLQRLLHLGGQRLDLSSLSKAKSNIAFRVALRAETAEDSRDVIGSDAALHLPSKENGYALLKVGRGIWSNSGASTCRRRSWSPWKTLSTEGPSMSASPGPAH